MHLQEAVDRYERDPQFKQLVDMMVHQALALQMSPGELREAAVFAEIHVLDTLHRFEDRARAPARGNIVARRREWPPG